MDLVGFLINAPVDVLSLLFELCTARDLVALTGLTRGVVGELRQRPCKAWQVAARAMLRNLCVSTFWPPLAPLALHQGAHSCPRTPPPSTACQRGPSLP